MKSKTLLAGVSIMTLTVGISLLRRDENLFSPPTMTSEGQASSGVIIKHRTIDYEAILRSALTEKASFLTLTLSQDILRDQRLETSIA